MGHVTSQASSANDMTRTNTKLRRCATTYRNRNYLPLPVHCFESSRLRFHDRTYVHFPSPSSQSRHQHPCEFHLLTFITEVRNVIYRIACNSEASSLEYDRLTLRRKGDTGQTDSFFKLAHVNGQFRNEYLPLYFQSRLSCIRYVGMAAYTQYFLIPHQSIGDTVTLDMAGTAATLSNDKVDMHSFLIS
ncbi:hypothetical protein BU25DRAFT_167728 [Macroventuria anomochaeta]|uniref:Uncharacterized protein n=1 Tax=Macroventuria anomochaeta TaxID=301207 RepID=A0ACB6RPK7_9PLEO|nr:uncharacterized protein BU25DRAFT_167728 [Macroventuria anomochaeta]KAF2623831.1 hypothetical protein BU25DRAFT_167728 [Macroventuria anomochaeta]